MQDEILQKVVSSIPQQPQRQYSTDEQLRILQTVANRLGLYDAAVRIERTLLAPTTTESRFVIQRTKCSSAGQRSVQPPANFEQKNS